MTDEADTTSIAYVVYIDTRIPVGVAQLVDSIWTNEAEAGMREYTINHRPRDYPNQVAWTEPARVEGGQLVPYEDARSHRGENNAAAKLNAQIVAEARQRYREGASVVKLAACYGVTVTAMYKAITGRTWRGVP